MALTKLQLAAKKGADCVDMLNRALKDGGMGDRDLQALRRLKAAAFEEIDNLDPKEFAGELVTVGKEPHKVVAWTGGQVGYDDTHGKRLKFFGEHLSNELSQHREWLA
jgi:hypothetical protein